jgi:hypothetical protein
MLDMEALGKNTSISAQATDGTFREVIFLEQTREAEGIFCG